MTRQCTFMVIILLTYLVSPALCQPFEPLFSMTAKERAPFLETLKELVSIESGSRDVEGLAQLAEVIASRLKVLGADVELITPSDVYKMEDTPDTIGKMVRATLVGTGKKKILLIAHMDTVYLKGMLAKQPFRIDGNRAYGLGIADDKQGIAVILHTLAILKTLDFRQYGLLTVLINGDEEISSPGSRALLTKLGAEHDVTFSLESSLAQSDKITLATSGIASINLKVEGRAAHSGVRPEAGVNALYELAHQVLQTRDLSEPEVGLKMNWTMATAGRTRNMIPPIAQAVADVRVQRVLDYDAIEKKVREKIKNQLLPETKVEMTFERRRPPLEAKAVSRSLAQRAQQIYGEIGKQLIVDETPEGGGTDAAFAALNATGPVIERLGLQGYGAHSIDAEWILLDSIEPRLYLLSRLIMHVSQSSP